MRAISYHPPVLELERGLTVRAVFDRAWHLWDESGAVLTVTAAPYDGPMAVRVEGALIEMVRPGMHGRLVGRRLIVGPVSMGLTGAREWTGERETVPPIERAALEQDVQRIRRCAGAGDLAILRRVEALREALASGKESDLRGAVRGLIGLGPGLTPAGDDVLCGAMAGLHVFGRRLTHGSGLRAKALGYAVYGQVEQSRSGGLQPALRTSGVRPSVAGTGLAAARLSAVVLDEMGARTTALSRTLLLWAARGLAVQPLLDVLWTLGSGEPVEGLETVAAIGHTSGRDMLAGAALAAVSVLGGQDDAPLVRATQHLP